MTSVRKCFGVFNEDIFKNIVMSSVPFSSFSIITLPLEFKHVIILFAFHRSGVKRK